MPHKLRKIRKKRGTRTQGYGRVGQHRKSGSKGRRKAGRHKHLWSYVVSKEPDYFKKGGFASPKNLGREVNAINIGELEELSQRITPKKRARDKTIAIIDLKELGYNKLLGKGKITKPIHVKVPSCSESAAKKIEVAGGQVIIEK
mgnify:CR=1 FL=1